MELCGLKRPAGPELHGRSLAPLLAGKKDAWPERTLVVDSQRLANLVKWRRCAVMTGEWRLVNQRPDGEPELYAIREDPGQSRNVASRHPEVIRRLKAEYEKWWTLVSARADEYVRISLGSPAEDPACLHAHDWLSNAAEQVLNQGQIREGPPVNGHWAVNVLRAGTYRFELRRWPRELGLAINAPYRDREPNRDTTPGRAIEVVKARVRIAGVERETKVAPDDDAAVFELKLVAGPAELQTWFADSKGAERGAYYVYVSFRG